MLRFYGSILVCIIISLGNGCNDRPSLYVYQKGPIIRDSLVQTPGHITVGDTLYIDDRAQATYIDLKPQVRHAVLLLQKLGDVDTSVYIRP